MGEALPPGQGHGADEVSVGFVDGKGRYPGRAVRDQRIDDVAEGIRILHGFLPQVARFAKARKLIEIVVIEGEGLCTGQGRIGYAVPVLDAHHTGLGSDAGIRFTDLEVDHHAAHVEPGSLVGNRFQHVRVMPRTVADLDTVGAAVAVLAHELPRLLRRMTLVRDAARVGPALVQHEPRHDGLVAVTEAALFDECLEARARTRVPERGHTVAQPETEGIGEGVVAGTPFRRYVCMQVEEAGQHVLAARIDDEIAGRALGQPAGHGHAVDGNDVDDASLFDDDVDGTLRGGRAATSRRTPTGHHDAATDDQPLRPQSLCRSQWPKQIPIGRAREGLR